MRNKMLSFLIGALFTGVSATALAHGHASFGKSSNSQVSSDLYNTIYRSSGSHGTTQAQSNWQDRTEARIIPHSSMGTVAYGPTSTEQGNWRDRTEARIVPRQLMLAQMESSQHARLAPTKKNERSPGA
jgi:hypothetical protein